MGGKCYICKYNKNVGSLDFHHVEEKSFGISDMLNSSLENLKNEADKTILVCKNCHYEVHAGMHGKIIKKYTEKLNKSL